MKACLLSWKSVYLLLQEASRSAQHLLPRESKVCDSLGKRYEMCVMGWFKPSVHDLILKTNAMRLLNLGTPPDRAALESRS